MEKYRGHHFLHTMAVLTTHLTFKDFDLNVGIVFSGGNKMYNGTRANMTDQRYFNNGTFIKERWTTPGQITEIPKLIYGDNVSTGFSITNSAYVEDGSYVKLKNLSLGYRLPVQRLTNNAISSARFMCRVQISSPSPTIAGQILNHQSMVIPSIPERIIIQS